MKHSMRTHKLNSEAKEDCLYIGYFIMEYWSISRNRDHCDILSSQDKLSEGSSLCVFHVSVKYVQCLCEPPVTMLEAKAPSQAIYMASSLV